MSDMRLRLLAADEPANWPEALTQPATFTALDNWSEVVRKIYKYPVYRLETEIEGRVTGLLALTLVRHPIFGNYLTTSPFGSYGGFAFSAPEARDLLLAEAQRLAGELGVDYVNIRWLDTGRPPEPAPLPTDLAQPFNPSGFDLPDREERPPAVANQTTRGGDAGGGNTAAAAPIPGDRELLETLAAKLPSTGYFNFRGEDILTLGGTNRVKIGGRFTVQHNGQPYELELTAINSNNFTLRYRSQEITRPIKSGK